MAVSHAVLTGTVTVHLKVCRFQFICMSVRVCINSMVQGMVDMSAQASGPWPSPAAAAAAKITAQCCTRFGCRENIQGAICKALGRITDTLNKLQEVVQEDGKIGGKEVPRTSG